MLLAKISCRRLETGDEEEQWDKFSWLLGSLTRDGNIVGRDWMVSKSATEFFIFTQLLTDDALREENLSKYAQAELAKLSTVGLGPPECEILGRHLEEGHACECEQSSWLILFTNYLTLQSAVRCGDCFRGIPRYRLSKLNDGTEAHNKIRVWASEYQACDTLQILCGIGEWFGTQQMSSVTSDLSLKGRAICAKLEELTGKPTYYYLFRYYGRSAAREQRRRCPDCGGDWLLAEPLHRIFDFKCERSRLLSNIAVSL